MTTTCPKCGGTMEPGITTATGLIGGAGLGGRKPKVVFVVTAKPETTNLINAFKDGLSGKGSNRVNGVFGLRCSRCGFLELYAGKLGDGCAHPATSDNQEGGGAKTDK